MRQMFLHEWTSCQVETDVREASSLVKILNWNIRNPSPGRARKQAEWLLQTHAEIIILTEARHSDGGRFLCDWLASYGFNIFFPHFSERDYGVIVATRGFDCQNLELGLDFLPYRSVCIECKTQIGDVEILGLYVPSRGAQERRNFDKKKFQEQITDWLYTNSNEKVNRNMIITGDLNVIERNHWPSYPLFGDWEYEFYESFLHCHLMDAYRLVHPTTQDYSWFGRKGCGYRFDHFFVSDGLSQQIIDCSYLHDAREKDLSDHSSMLLTLSLETK
jgi:exodeoxyribonuclease III